MNVRKEEYLFPAGEKETDAVTMAITTEVPQRA